MAMKAADIPTYKFTPRDVHTLIVLGFRVYIPNYQITILITGDRPVSICRNR
jgi:hypothetical protein